MVDSKKGRASLKFNRVIFMLLQYQQYSMISLARSLASGARPFRTRTLGTTICSMAPFGSVNGLWHANQKWFSQLKSPPQPNHQYQAKLDKGRVDIQQLINNYQKQANPSMDKNGMLLLKLLNLYPKQGVRNQDCPKVEQTLISIMQQFVGELRSKHLQSGHQNNIEFQVMINNYCFKSFANLVRRVSSSPESNASMQKLIQDEIIVDALLAQFGAEDFKFKSYAIKFIMQHHKKNARVLGKLQKTLQVSQNNHLIIDGAEVSGVIYYLRQLIRYSESCTEDTRLSILRNEVISSFLGFVYLKIMTIKPRMLNIVSEILYKLSKHPNAKQSINANVVLTAVEEHMKGIKLLGPSQQFMDDYINFIQILKNITKIQNQSRLHDLSERIKSATTNIYENIKNLHKDNIQKKGEQSQQEGQSEQNDDSTQTTSESSSKLEISMINVNIILGSMLKLNTIDPSLFEILEAHLFANLKQAHYQNIGIYMHERIKIIRAVTDAIRQEQNESAKARARMIKQEHGRFIVKMLDTLSQNKTLNLVNVLNLLKICQMIPTKSREIKRKLKALMQQQQYVGQINTEVQALSEIVMQGF